LSPSGLNNKRKIHKVSSVIGGKLVVGPERVIESEIPELFVIILIEETSGGSDHIDTKFTVKSHFSLIEGPYSYTYLNTHI
jgi:hypothetical protein